MKPFTLIAMSIALSLGMVRTTRADCFGCAGDVTIIQRQDDFWSESPPSQYSKHVHDFGPLCDAPALAGLLGEVNILIAVSADLEGATKTVTANFVSGGNVTPITSGNGFIDAPANGIFFKNGMTSCKQEENKALVLLDWDDFNDLLADGDGTMKIEVLASDDIQDVCDICCESGHSWTPAPCCSDRPPCPCPPKAQSFTEVTLVYLDCDIMGDLMCDPEDPEACPDDSLYCNGTELCDAATNVCAHTGNPCFASGETCDESIDDCVYCDFWGQGADAACEETDGVFCNGSSTCDMNVTPPVCVAGTAPCDAIDCLEEIDACFVCGAFSLGP